MMTVCDDQRILCREAENPLPDLWQLDFTKNLGTCAYAARKLDQSAARKVIHLTGGSFYALLI
jgi:hypothetical protein